MLSSITNAIGSAVRRVMLSRRTLDPTAAMASAIEHGGPVIVTKSEDKAYMRNTIICAAMRAVERAMAVIVVSAKRDLGMRDELAGAACRAGREFFDVSPVCPDAYQVPWDRLDEKQMVSMLLPDSSISEPYYRCRSERYIVQTLRVLRAAGMDLSLQEIVRCLDPTELYAVVRDLPVSSLCQQEAEAYLNALSERERKDLAGEFGRLSIFADSEISHWFGPAMPGIERFDLLKAIKDRAVVYFNMECDNWPMFAPILGAAIGQDLLSTVASLVGGMTPSLLAIARFTEIPEEHVQRLIGRGLSAGMSLLLDERGLSGLMLERAVSNSMIMKAPATGGCLVTGAGK